ncbi:MAG: hypothetical protein ACHQ51_01560 [Elusimicrobiota bacterium]
MTAQLLAFIKGWSPDVRYFAWQYLRALVWVIIVSWILRRAAGNAKVGRAFFLAHLAALAFGVATDAFMVNWAPKSWLDIEVLQWVFVAPIVIFTVISLWIGNWERPVKIPDVLMTLVPIAAWGLLVIYGWQSRMWTCHVLGAWFVSAAAGGLDLYTLYGPEPVRRRRIAARLAGYALIVLTVYLILPRTEISG